MSIPPILLVGCGRMGGAMLAGWREQGLAASVAVDPAPAAAGCGRPGPDGGGGLSPPSLPALRRRPWCSR